MDSVPHDHDAVVDAFLIAGSKSENTTIDASSAHVMTELHALIRQGADILLSYSTMHGYTAFRNIDFDTWYIQALVETFVNMLGKKIF